VVGLSRTTENNSYKIQFIACHLSALFGLFSLAFVSIAVYYAATYVTLLLVLLIVILMTRPHVLVPVFERTSKFYDRT